MVGMVGNVLECLRETQMNTALFLQMLNLELLGTGHTVFMNCLYACVHNKGTQWHTLEIGSNIQVYMYMQVFTASHILDDLCQVCRGGIYLYIVVS